MPAFPIGRRAHRASSFGWRPGVWSAAVGWGDPSAVTYGSTSTGYTTVRQGDGSLLLTSVAAGALRANKYADAAGRVLAGVLNESAITQLCRYTVAMSGWNQTYGGGMSLAATSVTLPTGAASTTQVYKEGAQTAERFAIYQQLATRPTNGQPYTFSAYLKKINVNRQWVQLALVGDVTDKARLSIDLTNGQLGVFSGAAKRDKGIIAVGGGWYYCWLTWDQSAGSTNDYPLVFSCDGDNDWTMDGGNADAWACWLPMVCAGDHPPSPVQGTAGADATRAVDTYTFEAAGNIGITEGAVRFRFLAPPASTATRTWTIASRRSLFSLYKDVNNRIEVYIHTDGTICAESAKTGGTAGAIALAGSVATNTIHEVLCTWKAGYLYLWCDGVCGSDDCDIPTTPDTISIGQDYNGANNAGPVIVGDVACYPCHQESWMSRGGGYAT